MKVWWVKIFVIPAETRIKFKIKRRSHYDFSSLFGDPAGARTQDPILKRDVLYQLSY